MGSLSILQCVLSSSLLISDMINADIARRKKMRPAIGRMRVQDDRNRIDIMAWEAVRTM